MIPSSLYDLDPGPEIPELVRMIVEIPKNSGNKYEYDGKLGVFRLDRPLYSPMHYPGDYGFIPGTLAEDHDPLDVLALVEEPSFAGCMIEVRPIGVLDMLDQDIPDQKILAVPVSSPLYSDVTKMDQVAPHVVPVTASSSVCIARARPRLRPPIPSLCGTSRAVPLSVCSCS